MMPRSIQCDEDAHDSKPRNETFFFKITGRHRQEMMFKLSIGQERYQTCSASKFNPNTNHFKMWRSPQIHNNLVTPRVALLTEFQFFGYIFQVFLLLFITFYDVRSGAPLISVKVESAPQPSAKLGILRQVK